MMTDTERKKRQIADMKMYVQHATHQTVENIIAKAYGDGYTAGYMCGKLEEIIKHQEEMSRMTEHAVTMAEARMRDFEIIKELRAKLGQSNDDKQRTIHK